MLELALSQLSSASPWQGSGNVLGWTRRIHKCQVPRAFFPIKMDLIQPQIKFLGASLETSMSAKKRNEKAFFQIFFFKLYMGGKQEEYPTTVNNTSLNNLSQSHLSSSKMNLPHHHFWSWTIHKLQPQEAKSASLAKVNISNLPLFHVSGLNLHRVCGLKEFYSCSDLWSGSCSKEVFGFRALSQLEIKQRVASEKKYISFS